MEGTACGAAVRRTARGVARGRRVRNMARRRVKPKIQDSEWGVDREILQGQRSREERGQLGEVEGVDRGEDVGRAASRVEVDVEAKAAEAYRIIVPFCHGLHTRARQPASGRVGFCGQRLCHPPLSRHPEHREQTPISIDVLCWECFFSTACWATGHHYGPLGRFCQQDHSRVLPDDVCFKTASSNNAKIGT